MKVSEAAMLKEIMVSKGVPEGDIILEEEATTTVYNAIKCRDIVRRLTNKEEVREIHVVTSDFHIERTR